MHFVDTPNHPLSDPNTFSRIKKIMFLAGPLLSLLMMQYEPAEGMTQHGLYVSAIAIWMIIWWMFEVVPLAVTALLPLVLMPFTGVLTMKDAAVSFSNPVIFLFLGGFFIAIAMEKQRLHMRIALHVVKRFGNSPNALIAGFMFSTMLLSMWMSNTATTLMMLPLSLVAIDLVRKNLPRSAPKEVVEVFAISMLLGVAYASSIGGIATLIGTPTNALFAGYVENTYGITISFRDWMAVGLPVSVILQIAGWVLFCFVLFRTTAINSLSLKGVIAPEIKKLGKVRKGEVIVGTIILITIAGWLFSAEIGTFLSGILGGDASTTISMDDATVAMIGGLLMFVVPISFKRGEFPLTWADAKDIPWGTLFLFGGGLALGEGFHESELDKWIALQLASIDGVSALLLIIMIAALTMALTEMMSNVATVTIFLPIIFAAAIGVNENPLLFAIPATMAASCAFMMPISTAPNAIVFATGKIRMYQMMYAGVLLNLVSLVIIVAVMYSFGPSVFDIELGVLPEWIQQK